MIKIRNSVFETNSSSVHSIVVSTEPVDFAPTSIYFELGEFGWSMDELDDSFARASYFYTAACCLYERDVAPELRYMLEPYGYNLVFDPPIFDEDGWLKNGYVDHVDECKEFVDTLMSDATLLINFIFDDRSFVITGNDNCDEISWDWMRNKVDRADAYKHLTFVKGN
jgi:hypothetical protein